jgi:hypothetical protein
MRLHAVACFRREFQAITASGTSSTPFFLTDQPARENCNIVVPFGATLPAVDQIVMPAGSIPGSLADLLIRMFSLYPVPHASGKDKSEPGAWVGIQLGRGKRLAPQCHCEGASSKQSRVWPKPRFSRLERDRFTPRNDTGLAQYRMALPTDYSLFPARNRTITS